MLALAADIQNHFGEGGEADDLTLYGRENNTKTNREVQICFSNDDMEDRDDLPHDAVIVDLDQWA